MVVDSAPGAVKALYEMAPAQAAAKLRNMGEDEVAEALERDLALSPLVTAHRRRLEATAARLGDSLQREAASLSCCPQHASDCSREVAHGMRIFWRTGRGGGTRPFRTATAMQRTLSITPPDRPSGGCRISPIRAWCGRGTDA